MYLRTLLFLFGIFQVSLVYSAILTMEGLNIQQCKHWYIEGGGPAPGDENRFCTPQPDLNQYCETLFTQDSAGAVIISECKTQLSSDGNNIDSYQCEKSNGFPMSNATFQLISKEKELPTYECIEGCTDDIATTIYDLGYESAPNIKFEQDFAEFIRKCGAPKP